MPPLSMLARGDLRPQVQDPWGRSPSDPDYGRPPAGTPLADTIGRGTNYYPPPAAGEDWFAQQGAPGGDRTYISQSDAEANRGGADTSWWNPQDPQGSIQRLFGGQPPSSQTILAHAPQLQAVGIEISPPNAEGVTSKIHIPGVGWTRILEGGVAGGQGTGWNYVPQGVTGPGGTIPIGGGGAGAIGAGLEQTPGYQFRLGQGLQALERSAAARGTLLTGGTLKGMQRYAQDVASQEYGNRVGQLQNLAQLGYGAAGGQAQLGAAQAGATGDLITGGGNAQAAGTIGQGNALQQGLGGVSNALQQYYLYKLLQGGRI